MIRMWPPKRGENLKLNVFGEFFVIIFVVCGDGPTVVRCSSITIFIKIFLILDESGYPNFVENENILYSFEPGCKSALRILSFQECITY
jgi:hypothetical protein